MIMESYQTVFINMLLGHKQQKRQVLKKSCFLLKAKYKLVKTDETNVQMS